MDPLKAFFLITAQESQRVGLMLILPLQNRSKTQAWCRNKKHFSREMFGVLGKSHLPVLKLP
jgi:hypothetical protein